MDRWILLKHLEQFIQEDLGDGDITTRLCVEDEIVKGVVTSKEDFVLSGVREATVLFEDHGVEVKEYFDPGDRVGEGDVLMEVRGPASVILSLERLALNLIMRMSGIATKVRSMVDAAEGTVVACTRKTTPGFRYFEKKAVQDGGGDTHRMRLDDMVLVKDNHIALAGGLQEAIERAKKASFSKKIDVEVVDFEGAVIAAENGADIVMLDNMSPSEVERAYTKIKDIRKDILVEVSGNIDIYNVKDYTPHADVVSSGALTHSAPAVDVSMTIER